MISNCLENEINANLVEAFSSIQGEGPFIGVRQIFLRFSECNLKCGYCDTDHKRSKAFRIEYEPGSNEFSFYPNPVTPGQLMKILNKIGLDHCHSISLTGGEPLLDAAFIKSLSSELKLNGQKNKPLLYLETNGTLPEKLGEIIDEIDIISMDIKLPSVYGGVGLWDAHRKFAEMAAEKTLFVKVVVSDSSTNEEMLHSFELISKIGRNIPVVIQPLTPHEGFMGKAPQVPKLLLFQEMGLKYIDDVRVIPQCHKMLGCL